MKWRVKIVLCLFFAHYGICLFAQSDTAITKKNKNHYFSIEAIGYPVPKLKEKSKNISSLETDNTFAWGSNVFFHNHFNEKWAISAGLGFTKIHYKYKMAKYYQPILFSYDNKLVAYRINLGIQYQTKRIEKIKGKIFGRAVVHTEMRHVYQYSINSVSDRYNIFPDYDELSDYQWWYLYGSFTLGWLGLKDKLFTGMIFSFGENIQPEGGGLIYDDTPYTSNRFISIMIGYRL